MKTIKSYRDIENAARTVADAAAKCAELEENSNSTTEAEAEEAVKNLLLAIIKLKSL